jgi:hypothetical protein
VWAEGSSTPLLTGRDESSAVRKQADADAEFVAHAREDVLTLLALLEPAAAGQPVDLAGEVGPETG